MAFEHLPYIRVTRLLLLVFAILTITFISSLSLPPCAMAGQVAVAWDPDTSAGVAGYKVYWGTVSRSYSWYADTATQTSYTVPGLTPGATYYISATAYDGSRNESGFSNEVAYTVPLPCSFALSPGSAALAAAGGTGSVTVTTSGACSWTTANLASWVTITSGASGSGSGTVKYSVSPNTDAASRTTNVTIAGVVFTVTQAGAPPPNTITASAGPGGSISPSGSVSVNAGTNQNFTITPASGHNVVAVTVDGASVGAVTSYTFNNVTANHSISAVFTQTVKAYTLAVLLRGSGSGGVTRRPSVPSFPAGTVVTLTAFPGKVSVFAGWSGACSGTSPTCTLTMTSDATVTATFNARYAWWLY